MEKKNKIITVKSNNAHQTNSTKPPTLNQVGPKPTNPNLVKFPLPIKNGLQNNKLTNPNSKPKGNLNRANKKKQPILIGKDFNNLRPQKNGGNALALNKSSLDVLDETNFKTKIHGHREKVPFWFNWTRRKYLLVIGGVISGLILIIAIILLLLCLLGRTPGLKSNSDWRRFVTNQQLYKLTETEAQDVIDQYRDQWPMWIDVVQRNGSVVDGARLIDGVVEPYGINQIESITVFDPTPNVWTQPFNVNDDLQFQFNKISYTNIVKGQQPLDTFTATFGDGQAVNWINEIEAKNQAQTILEGITETQLASINSTNDLEDYLKENWQNIESLIDFDIDKIEDVDFHVSKSILEGTPTYNIQAIVTLGPELFAAQQPVQLTNLNLAKDLNDSNVVDWDHDVIKQFISSNEAITSKATLNVWLADPANENIIKTWFTNADSIRSYSIIAVNDAPLSLLPSLALIPGGRNAAQTINNLTIKGPVNWDANHVLEQISLIPNLNGLDALRNWFANVANQPTIKNWFTNSSNATISVTLQGTDVITLVPSVVMKQGFNNTATVSPIGNLRIVDTNWNHNNVLTAIEQISQITNLQTLNNWLIDVNNQPTIKSWFTNADAINSISITASGNGPFRLTPLVSLKPGFINVSTISPINNFSISNTIAWDINQVRTQLMNNPQIFDRATLVQWLASASNQATIKSWFSNNQNANISVSVSGNGPFTLVPNIVMNPGYINKTPVNSLTNFVFNKSVNWISIDTIKNQIANQASIVSLSTLNNWLSNSSNQATIKNWFSQSTYIQSVSINASITNGSFVLNPTITMQPGFVNTSSVGQSSSFTIGKSINWVSINTITSQIAAQASIVDLNSLNTWIGNNQATVRNWFSPNSYIQSVAVNASLSSGSFRLTPNIVMNPGFVNTSSIGQSSSFTIGKNVNWIPKDQVQNVISGVASITDLSSMNAWLSSSSNAATIKAWFTNNQNVESVQVRASGSNPFVLTPTIRMKSGFTNTANIGSYSGIFVSRIENFTLRGGDSFGLITWRAQNDLVAPDTARNVETVREYVNNKLTDQSIVNGMISQLVTSSNKNLIEGIRIDITETSTATYTFFYTFVPEPGIIATGNTFALTGVSIPRQ